MSRTPATIGSLERFYQHAPLRSSTEAANAKERFVDRHDSGYAMDSAGAKATGRSRTVQLSHGSGPFFRRGGVLMARTQIEQALKLELLIPVRCAEKPTACMSFNYHRDHFGSVWGLQDKTGDISHTACVAFGMDRLALAMFVAHGVELAKWPNSVLTAPQLQEIRDQNVKL
jgi:hypothetical protein